MAAELDKSGWITPHEPYDRPSWLEDRKWDVLLRLWGSADVTSVGPFDAWDAAEEWAEYQVMAKDATILGIAEARRPKGNDYAQRARRRGSARHE